MSEMDTSKDEPSVRLAPTVQAQLDAAKTPSVFGFPARTSRGLDLDTILVLSTSVLEAEARAWVHGRRLGPLKFTHERGVNSFRMICSAEILPQDDA